MRGGVDRRSVENSKGIYPSNEMHLPTVTTEENTCGASHHCDANTVEVVVSIDFTVVEVITDRTWK